MNQKNIQITDHVCERYIERINPNLQSIRDYNSRLIAAKKAIKAVLQDAKYISDNERGILLRSDTFKCCLIISKRRLITIYSYKPQKESGQ
ncbi:MAG: hypothetical protein HYS25_01040 [Ignavibacteriales bacterium]|nr:hypothetical protein [Ignavibacteriales bacterium]